MIGPLLRELLIWVSERPRTYEETMEAWRSSCPRHPVWEDACVEGLVEVAGGGTEPSRVALTPLGRAALDTEAAG